MCRFNSGVRTSSHLTYNPDVYVSCTLAVLLPSRVAEALQVLLARGVSKNHAPPIFAYYLGTDLGSNSSVTLTTTRLRSWSIIIKHMVLRMFDTAVLLPVNVTF